LGTRITEESHLKPKPMIEVGGRPLIWHIMKIYSHYGFNDFVVCLGYKGFVVKEYFANYYMYSSDVTFDLSDNSFEFHKHKSEDWRVTLVETGLDTATGGRLKQLEKYLGNETFMFTYGDGVSDIDINKLLEYHNGKGTLATMTVVNSAPRFGVIEIDDCGKVTDFREKSENDTQMINGGFMVLNPKVLGYIDGYDTPFEREPLERLARMGQLSAYRYGGFWYCMDTLRDMQYLERAWNANEAPWKVW